MCLTSYNTGVKSGVFRAGYDILVFKELDRGEFIWDAKKGRYRTPGYVSPYQYHEYKIGKREVVKNFDISRGWGGSYHVNQGLHAHRRLHHLNKDDRDSFFPAIIPKGTLFIPGIYDDIASLALVVHSWRWYDARGLKNIKRGDFTLHERVCSLDYYKDHPELVK